MTASRNDGTEGTWYPTLAPEDDSQSAANSVAFDKKAVEAARKEFYASFTSSNTAEEVLAEAEKIQAEETADAAPAKTTTKDKE